MEKQGGDAHMEKQGVLLTREQILSTFKYMGYIGQSSAYAYSYVHFVSKELGMEAMMYDAANNLDVVFIRPLSPVQSYRWVKKIDPEFVRCLKIVAWPENFE